jgi:hydroxyacylglutathione hydrolase
MASGAQILDIRSPTSFAGGHVPGSLNVWRDGMSVFMGWFIDYDRPLVLITEANMDIMEVAAECARIGYDNLAGFLASDFSAFFKAGEAIETMETVSAPDLQRIFREPDLFLLDVRDVRNREHEGFIPGSFHIYVGELPMHLADVPRDRHVVVYCDSGFKGSIGASLLAKAGYPHVANLLGGMTGWINAGYPVERMEKTEQEVRSSADEMVIGVRTDDRP